MHLFIFFCVTFCAAQDTRGPLFSQDGVSQAENNTTTYKNYKINIYRNPILGMFTKLDTLSFSCYTGKWKAASKTESCSTLKKEAIIYLVWCNRFTSYRDAHTHSGFVKTKRRSVKRWRHSGSIPDAQEGWRAAGPGADAASPQPPPLLILRWISLRSSQTQPCTFCPALVLSECSASPWKFRENSDHRGKGTAARALWNTAESVEWLKMISNADFKSFFFFCNNKDDAFACRLVSCFWNEGKGV